MLTILLLFEAGFRYYFFGVNALLHPVAYNHVALLRTNFVAPATDPKVSWRLRANSSGIFKAGQFSTNEHGLRNPPISKTKSEGEIRIAILGSSVSMGSGVDDHEVYSRRLQLLLNRTCPARCKVINFSVGGYEFNQIDAAYDEFVRPFSPDLILLPMTIRGYLDKNKTIQWPLSYAITGWTDLRPYLEHLFIYPALQKWFSEFFRKNLSSDWGKHNPGIRNTRFLKFKNVYVNTGKLVRNFIAKRYAEGIPVVVTLLKSPWDIPHPFKNAALHLVENSLDDVDGDFLINTNKTITRELTSKESIYYGDNHPNADVHAVIAAAIYQDLWPLLKHQFDLE